MWHLVGRASSLWERTLLLSILLLALGTEGAPGAGRADTTRSAAPPSVFASEAGRLVRRYVGPDAYGAHKQNWDAAQGPSGTFYVANTDGVLVYDGRGWHTLPTANRSIARSVAADTAGRVFVGAQRDFGVLRRDSVGRRHFVSLLDHVPEAHRSFTDVWRTEVTSTGVYFQSYRRLFRWRPAAQAMQSWGTPTQFQFADVVRDTVYVNEEGRGLMRVQGDSLRRVPGGTRFADRTVRFVLPRGEQGLLVGTGDRLFVRADSSFQPISTPIDDALRAGWVYHATALPDGTIAIATIDRGLFLLAPDGTRYRHLAARNQPVTAVYAGREGGLWALMDGGLLRYAVGAPFTEHGPATGLNGSVVDVARHRDTLYAATLRSTYRLQPRADTLARFVPAVASTQSWTLLSVGDDLLVGTVNGLQWRGPNGREQRVFEARHVYDLLRSRQHPGRVYAATGRGVRRVVRTETGWAAGPPVPGLDAEARSLAEAADGTLWVGTFYDGVYRIRFNGARDSAVVDHFGPEQGLPPDRVDPYRWQGHVVVGTRTGPMRFVPGAAPPFAPVASVDPPPWGAQEGPVRLRADAQGRAWGPTGGGPGRWVRRDTTWQWAPGPLGRLRGRTINALRIEDGGRTLWWATQDGLLRYRPGSRRSEGAPPAQVHRVRTLDTDSLLATAGATLSYAQNGLRITYGTPSLVVPQSVAYQTRLLGQRDGWSDWTGRTERELPALSPGRYTFAVRARTAYGDTTQAARYAFTVRPPWYRTWWAYGLYVLVALGLVGGAVQWRTRRLRRRQEALERTVAARTAEIEQQKERLAEQAERLEEMDEAKSRFFANVSHEFRTPLTLIRGPVQEVRERLQRTGADLEAEAEQLAMVERNTDRLQRLVDQLLGLARMDAGAYTLAARPTALGPAVERIARPFEPLAERHNLKLTVEREAAADSGSAEPVFVDREALEHVLGNLLSNAIKFTPEDGRVRVTVREEAEAAVVRVADTGPGIPAEQQEAVFDRFAQIGEASAGAQEGIGIGLAFTKDLVALHGGTIALESTEGEGTTVTVRFPRGADHLAEEQIAGEKRAVDADASLPERPPTPAAGEQSAPASNASPASSRRVLVVDDNADVRRYVRSVLAPAVGVIEAASGQAGLEAARTHHPDVILADVRMPELDGVEMTRRLRAGAATEGIPVVMLTARAGPEAEVEGLKAGADDYITKPFDADVLTARVHGVLALRQRLRRALRRQLRGDGEATGSPSLVANGPSEPRSSFEQEARSVIREHLTESSFDVDALAAAMAVSRTTLYRRANEADAPSPAALIQQVRMEQAAHLLRTGAGTVTEVAYAVGFESLSSFSHQFRDHFDVPPSTYVA